MNHMDILRPELIVWAGYVTIGLCAVGIIALIAGKIARANGASDR